MNPRFSFGAMPPEGARTTTVAPEPTLYPYQVVRAVGALVTVKSFWAEDDDKARAIAGELPPGHYLFREVERASPGKGGVL